VVGSVGW